jgi:hypothetical protein
MISVEGAQIEIWTRWRFTPYRRGHLVRVQIYGRRNEQWRILLGDEEEPGEWIDDRNHPHWRMSVASIEGLVAALIKLARRAASFGANIAVAAALFDDAVTMGKGQVAFWLGWGIDFDTAKGQCLGPHDGLARLIAEGLMPEYVALTGSVWKNGRGEEPKMHALYQWDEPIPEAALDRAERVVKAVTAAMGGDPACAHCDRVLRLPGSIHLPDVGAAGVILWPAELCRLVDPRDFIDD